jgi:hypothetical protein
MTPYHYTRVESFDDHDVLVVGGSDHPAGQHPSEYYNAYAQLEQYARERWTQAGEVLYRWTGQVIVATTRCDVFPRPVNGNLRYYGSLFEERHLEFVSFIQKNGQDVLVWMRISKEGGFWKGLRIEFNLHTTCLLDFYRLP